MSGIIGMDPEEIRILANRLRSQAQALSSLLGQVDSVVQSMSHNWHGPIADEFTGWWQHKYRPALLKAKDAVAGLAQSADNNASQQDGASEVSGTSKIDPASVGVQVGSGAPLGAVATAAAARSSQLAKGASSIGAATAELAARQGMIANLVGAYPVGSTVGPGDSRGYCVGLFEEYTMKYVHTPEVLLGSNGGACELYTRFNEIPALVQSYVQVPAAAVPQAGDVAVWDSTTPHSEGYGHVAIVTGVNGHTVNTLQQNYVPNKVSDGSFSVGEPHLLGYLRPKHIG